MQSIRKFLVFNIITLLLMATGQTHAAPIDFQLADINGNEHRLSSYRGKWVIVNYWATWCVPCRDEIPDLQRFHRRFKDQAVVIGINMEETSDENIREFIKHYQISYSVLLTEVARVGPLGEILGMPTTFIVSPVGEVVKRVLGRVDIHELEEFLSSNSVPIPIADTLMGLQNNNLPNLVLDRN